MTTLFQLCQTLQSKIEALALANDLAEDLKYIQQRTQEWQATYKKVVGLRVQTELLTLSIQDLEKVASKKGALRQNAQKILTRMLAKESPKQLTRHAGWTRLLNSCDGLAEELDKAGRKAWQAYLDQLGIMEKPSTLRQRTPSTPLNEEALKDYQASHSAYAAIAVLEMPLSADDLEKVMDHVTACRRAFARLTFDLPDEVRMFFLAVNAGTATLAHVTPKVVTWLKEQGQLDRFRVRSLSQ